MVLAPTNDAFAALLSARPELGVYLNTTPELAAALAGYHGMLTMMLVSLLVDVV